MRIEFITRRAFCRSTVFVPVGAFVSLLGCATVPIYRTTIANGRVFVPFDRFDPEPDEATAIMVRAAGVNDPIIVIRLKNGVYSAVSGRCTHLGCDVRPSGRYLRCPCHGSTYALDGTVVRGPAQASLTPIPVNVSARGVELLLMGI